MLELLILAGIAAFIYVKLSAFDRRIERLELELQRAEAERFALAARQAPPSPGPSPSREAPPQSRRGEPDPGSAAPSTPEPPAPRPAPASVPPTVGPPATAPAPSYGSLEERLGTTWAVWIGGLALAAGGIFLVKYSIEAGLIGPEVRTALGALLAAALVSAGEWSRRNELPVAVTAFPKAHIPSVLTAAGTVVAFATIYAGHALYGFIGPALAFILLGATGIATMIAAALHGPALAGIGLVGSFATPLLVSSDKPNLCPVVMFLAVVAASSYALARLRRWLWLAIATGAGAAIWGAVLLVAVSDSTLRNFPASATHDLAQLALAAAFLGYLTHVGTRDEDAKPDVLVSLVLLGLAFVTSLALLPTLVDFNSKLALALASIALLTLTAWVTPPAAAAIAIAALPALAILIVWPDLQAVVSTAPEDAGLAPSLAMQPISPVFQVPESGANYLGFAVLATLVPAIFATVRVWQSPNFRAPIAAWYSLGATVPPLLALVIAYLRIGQFEISPSFALLGVSLAALFAIGADQYSAPADEPPSPAWNIASAALAAAAIAALCFALTASLERGYLTVAFALAALGTAFVSTLRDIPLLRYAVSALGLIVLGRIVWDPLIMGADVGRTPIFNWLLLGYGVPAAAFGLSAWLLRGRGEDLAVRLSDSLMLIFVALLAFFQIRHFATGGDVLTANAGYLSQGLTVLVALGLSLATARMHMARANIVFDYASLIFAGAALVFATLGLAIFANPLFTNDPVAGPVLFGSLAAAYLLPGVAALYVARVTRGDRPQWFTTALTVLGVVLLFLFVTLEVRHAFNGPIIGLDKDPSGAEEWALSVSWLALGIAFLAYGVWRGSKEARLASAALVTLAAVKVGVFDLAGLSGLWRALSFICLGAVLIGIGLVYQKLIFAKTDPGDAPLAPA